MSVLVSSVGRRGSLVEICRRAVASTMPGGRVVGTDITPYCPAGQLVDALHLVPRCSHPDWVDAVLDVCGQEGVKVIFPTIDTELPFYARNRQRFADAGIAVMVSSEQAIEAAGNKTAFASFCIENGLPAPRTFAVDEVLGMSDAPYPLFFKPRHGSSGIGAVRVDSHAELNVAASVDGVVQDFLDGPEYTCDVYIDRTGAVRGVVPRQRLEVRAGEVSKGVTEANATVTETVTNTAAALVGAHGVITVQVILTHAGPRLVEINSRLGGGYPLADAAGADFVSAFILESQGQPISDELFTWKDDLVMLRYDTEAFVDGKQLKSQTTASVE